MPSISVIIPVYNSASTLVDAVRSVQFQTFPSWEIIAIDDGSTDKSPMLLDEMAICDVRIRVIHRQNFGPGVARNVGISEAKGEYIMFLDSDDMLASEDVLAKAFERVEATKCDCLLAGARSVTITGKKGEMLRWCLRTDLAPSADVFSAKSAGLELFFLAGPVPWAKLFRREFILHHNLLFPDLCRSEDFPFVQLALALSQRMTILDEPLVLHRMGVAGSLESTKDETPCMFAEAERIFFKELRSRGLEGEFKNAARARAMLRLYYNLNAVRSFNGLNAVYDCVRDERAMLVLPKECEMFADFASAKKNVDKILSYGSAGEWLLQRLFQAETQLRNVRADLRDCQDRLAKLSRSVNSFGKNVSSQKKCFGCLVMKFVTWPARKVYGGIKCLRENGVKYTIKHTMGKVLRKFESKCKW